MQSRSHLGLGQTLIQRTVSLHKEEILGTKAYTDTGEKSHVKTEAKIGIMVPPTKECQGSLATTRS